MKYVVQRTVDRLGRLVIPKDMRRHFGFEEGTEVLFCLTDQGILLTGAEETVAEKQSMISKP